MSLLKMDTSTLARLLQVHDVSAVETNSALIEASLQKQGILTINCLVAAYATVAIETAWEFKPIKEFGTDEYFEKSYGGRLELGNIYPGDGAKYCGRGFVQITGRTNYTLAAIADNPDKALEPQWAADYLAEYFKKRSIDALANSHRWVQVRKRVNGGTNGLEEFFGCVARIFAGAQ